MKAAAAIFLNEIKIELRSLQGLVASGMISLVLLFALRFTLSSEDIDQAQLAPGILWSAVIFSGMGLLSNTSIKANERGTIDFMRMIPVPKSTIFFGKVFWLQDRKSLADCKAFYRTVNDFSSAPRWPIRLGIDCCDVVVSA